MSAASSGLMQDDLAPQAKLPACSVHCSDTGPTAAGGNKKDIKRMLGLARHSGTKGAKKPSRQTHGGF